MATCVYYAHPLTEYDTQREELVVAGLELCWDQVVNPNTPEHSAGYAAHGMAHFDRVCADCDACVFSSFSDGKVGAGVYREAQQFLETGRPVFEAHVVGLGEQRQAVLLPTGGIDPRRVLTIEQTRKRIQEGRS